MFVAVTFNNTPSLETAEVLGRTGVLPPAEEERERNGGGHIRAHPGSMASDVKLEDR